MIFGIGVDIIRVERIREAVERWGESFLRRIFTDGEIAYCYKKKNPFLSLSARFAAKEALIKAIGHAVSVPFSDIEVMRSEKGRPMINPKGKLKEFFIENSVGAANVSLSHENEYAIAFVVIEKDG